MISVEAYPYGGYLVTDLDSDKTILFQSDYDFPGLANTFGWRPSDIGAKLYEDSCSDDLCNCSGTDGTLQCRVCGTKVGTYIESAAEYLDSDPAQVEDPGYFTLEER